MSRERVGVEKSLRRTNGIYLGEWWVGRRERGARSGGRVAWSGAWGVGRGAWGVVGGAPPGAVGGAVLSASGECSHQCGHSDTLFVPVCQEFGELSTTGLGIFCGGIGTMAIGLYLIVPRHAIARPSFVGMPPSNCDLFLPNEPAGFAPLSNLDGNRLVYVAGEALLPVANAAVAGDPIVADPSLAVRLAMRSEPR